MGFKGQVFYSHFSQKQWDKVQKVKCYSYKWGHHKVNVKITKNKMDLLLQDLCKFAFLDISIFNLFFFASASA